MEHARMLSGCDPYPNVMTAEVTLLSDEHTELTLELTLMTAAVGLVRHLEAAGARASCRHPPGLSSNDYATGKTMHAGGAKLIRPRHKVIPVADSAPATRRSQRSQEAAVASLAKETQTSPDVVKRLYDEEMAALQTNAKVGNFIGVIAGRRVKKRLMAQKANDGKISREAGTDRRSP